MLIEEKQLVDLSIYLYVKISYFNLKEKNC